MYQPVVDANTVVNIRTMVVEVHDTSIARPTVLTPDRSYESARVAQVAERILTSPRLPLFIKLHLETNHTKKKHTEKTISYGRK